MEPDLNEPITLQIHAEWLQAWFAKTIDMLHKSHRYIWTHIDDCTKRTLIRTFVQPDRWSHYLIFLMNFYEIYGPDEGLSQREFICINTNACVYTVLRRQGLYLW